LKIQAIFKKLFEKSFFGDFHLVFILIPTFSQALRWEKELELALNLTSSLSEALRRGYAKHR
jgi:hypothetical protein